MVTPFFSEGQTLAQSNQKLKKTLFQKELSTEEEPLLKAYPESVLLFRFILMIKVDSKVEFVGILKNSLTPNKTVSNRNENCNLRTK